MQSSCSTLGLLATDHWYITNAAPMVIRGFGTDSDSQDICSKMDAGSVHRAGHSKAQITSMYLWSVAIGSSVGSIYGSPEDSCKVSSDESVGVLQGPCLFKRRHHAEARLVCASALLIVLSAMHGLVVR